MVPPPFQLVAADFAPSHRSMQSREQTRSPKNAVNYLGSSFFSLLDFSADSPFSSSSFCAFLNSFIPLPSPRISSGIFRPPNSSRIISTRTIISVGPGENNSTLFMFVRLVEGYRPLQLLVSRRFAPPVSRGLRPLQLVGADAPPVVSSGASRLIVIG